MKKLGFGLGSTTSRKSNVATPPVNTVAPVASGTAIVGETLTTTDGTWTGTAPITYTYQWRRDGVNIGSATNNTYVLVSADASTNVDCVVTGTNSLGNSTADSNDIAVAAEPTLLEDFEALDGSGIPTGGAITWTLGSGTAAQSRTQSTSHVTQGVYSLKVEETAADGEGGISIIATGVDLTGYAELKIDVVIETASTGGFSLYISTGDFSVEQIPFTPSGTTGTFTLTADLTVFADLTDMYVSFGPYGLTPRTLTYYIDNLRAL